MFTTAPHYPHVDAPCFDAHNFVATSRDKAESSTVRIVVSPEAMCRTIEIGWMPDGVEITIKNVDRTPQAGLTPRALQVLDFLEGHGPLRSFEASLVLGISPGSFRRRITELRCAGYTICKAAVMNPETGRWDALYALDALDI